MSESDPEIQLVLILSHSHARGSNGIAQWKTAVCQCSSMRVLDEPIMGSGHPAIGKLIKNPPLSPLHALRDRPVTLKFIDPLRREMGASPYDARRGAHYQFSNVRRAFSP